MSIRSVVLAAAAAMVSTACGNVETSENDSVIPGLEQTRDALQQAQSAMGLGAGHSLSARSTLRDELQQTHTRYEHFYRGVRVWGGDTIVHDTAGGLQVTGNRFDNIRINTVPTLGEANARDIAHSALKPRGRYVREPSVELVIYPRQEARVIDQPMRGPGGELTATDIEYVVTSYALAYHVHSELENGADETKHTDYLLDAHTGAIIKEWSSLETTAAIGTGYSQHNGTVQLDTNSISGGWELRDVVRGMSYATYNLNHGTSGTGTLYTDADNIWGDGTNYISGGSTTSANGQTAAVDVHFGLGRTYDYYRNVHGRNGIDNAGTATYSRVHYGSNYDNAFWSDSCFCMTYGDGSAFRVLSALDVTAHEMTHGVTSRTANLTYSGESGGINESTSDIAGAMVEFYARGGSGSTIGNTGGNWTIGEQLRTAPLRYMYKPSKDGSSPDAWNNNIGGIDVHYSSGPHNRMFYFLSQGASSSPTSDFYSPYLPGGMTGIGNDRAARIAYRALTVYENSSTNYAGARTAFENAARDLYGLGSAEYVAVQNAFVAINVGSIRDVGVLSATSNCPGGVLGVSLHMDNEDARQASRVSGWVGATNVDGNGNTNFYFCRVDGNQFHSLGSGNSSRTNFAVLLLGTNCPPGSVLFSRHFDNEDDNNSNSYSGYISPNVMDRNTTLNFCLFKGDGTVASELPSLGFDYGVFAGSGFAFTTSTGYIYTDDEDGSNANSYSADPAWKYAATAIVTEGTNTTLYTARASFPRCGDNICNGLETDATCAVDCDRCGNGSCSATEQANNSCAYDCGFCGDGLCGYQESAYSCYEDCGYCGDGICSSGEFDCTNDCGSCVSVAGSDSTILPPSCFQ